MNTVRLYAGKVTAIEQMTTRLTISIDDDVAKVLEVVADREVRTLANLAAAIVTLKTREWTEDGTVTKADLETKSKKK